MRRRTYLATVVTLGGVALAGCGEGGRPTETTTEPTGTSTRTEAPTTETSPQTDTTSEPSETETTLDPADRDLDSATSFIAEAIERYVDSSSSGRELTDVTAAVSISISDVRGPLYDARDVLRDLDNQDLTDAQSDRHGRLWGCYWFAWWLASTHDAVNDVERRFSSAWRRILDQEYAGASNRLDRIEGETGIAEDELQRLVADSDPGDTAAFDRLTEDDYSTKVAQIEEELEHLRSIVSPMEEILAGLRAFASGVERYTGGETDYEAAADAFFRATRAFQRAVRELESERWTDAIASTAEDALCAAEALAAGCESLDDAAQWADAEREERQRLAHDDAEREFEACSLVMEEFDAVADLFE